MGGFVGDWMGWGGDLDMDKLMDEAFNVHEGRVE
jgi:hypothetical protein